LARPLRYRPAQISKALLLASLVAGCAIGQPPTGQASGLPAASVVMVARDIAFEPAALEVPSGLIVGITLDNRDPGILHNITLVSSAGEVAFRGETFAGLETRTYVVAPLEAGEFRLLCDVHPTMTASLRATP
jgi:plastocyanin